MVRYNSDIPRPEGEGGETGANQAREFSRATPDEPVESPTDRALQYARPPEELDRRDPEAQIQEIKAGLSDDDNAALWTLGVELQHAHRSTERGDQHSASAHRDNANVALGKLSEAGLSARAGYLQVFNQVTGFTGSGDKKTT